MAGISNQALVPFDNANVGEPIEGAGENKTTTEAGAISEIPVEMMPMMEEMESVLYSISFGKQEASGRTKF